MAKSTYTQPLSIVRQGWHTRVVRAGKGKGSYTRKGRQEAA